MNWFKQLFRHRPTIEEITDAIIARKLAEYQAWIKVFCKDCINIHRPKGWPLDAICPESECLAGGIVNYVTGETEHWLCKYHNSKGCCQYFNQRVDMGE